MCACFVLCKEQPRPLWHREVDNLDYVDMTVLCLNYLWFILHSQYDIFALQRVMLGISLVPGHLRRILSAHASKCTGTSHIAVKYSVNYVCHRLYESTTERLVEHQDKKTTTIATRWRHGLRTFYGYFNNLRTIFGYFTCTNNLAHT